MCLYFGSNKEHSSSSSFLTSYLKPTELATVLMPRGCHKTHFQKQWQSLPGTAIIFYNMTAKCRIILRMLIQSHYRTPCRPSIWYSFLKKVENYSRMCVHPAIPLASISSVLPRTTPLTERRTLKHRYRHSQYHNDRPLYASILP